MKITFVVLVLLSSFAVSLADSAAPRSTVSVNGTTYPVYTEQPTSTTPPEYPYNAAKQNQGGLTTVIAVVDAKGKIKATALGKSDAGPEIQAAVVKAVRQWRYPVVREGGSPIEYAVIVPLKMGPDRPAAPSASKPSLAEAVSDPKYLAETLGPKVLVLADPKTGSISTELSNAIKQAKLDQGHQFIALPAGASRPAIKSSVQPVYPSELKDSRISGEADFLVFIGTDGNARGIYCYNSTHPAFAAAGAAALARWHFTPAKIGDTAVPILVAHVIEFSR
jgi:outer membrane biosynthesis protein TonB